MTPETVLAVGRHALEIPRIHVHGGGPDWGSGPTGKGKLYKISYTDRDHPQPVLAWPNGPRERPPKQKRQPEAAAREGCRG